MKGWNAVLLVSLLVVPLMTLPSCAGKKAMKSSAPSAPVAEKAPEVSPPPAPPSRSLPKELLVFEDIHFDYDKSSLRSDAQATLSKHAKTMLDRPDVTIRIEGHCDERGTVEYNLALGDRRAQATLEYLVAYGVTRDRISIVSYGKERPLDPGHDESAWATNRRATFVILTGA